MMLLQDNSLQQEALTKKQAATLEEIKGLANQVHTHYTKLQHTHRHTGKRHIDFDFSVRELSACIMIHVDIIIAFQSGLL